MVVTCTNCQAKFRVPDERIGGRGAKVRCSRCRTVFVVLPEIGSVPAPAAAPASPPAADLDLEARTSAVRAPRSENPFVTNPVVRSVAGQPPAADAPAPFPPPAPDPFAAAARAPAPDPFAAAAAPAPDPFAAAGFAQDPFSQPAPAADPFADPSAPPRSTLPVTDLSDLLGGQASGAPPRPPTAREPVDPFAGAPAAAAPPFPRATDPFVAAAPATPPPLPAEVPDPFAAARAAAAPGPAASELALEAPSAPVDRSTLALEDRLTPPPLQAASAPEAPLEIAEPTHAGDAPLEVADPSLELGGSPAHGEAFDRDAFDLGYAGAEDPLDVQGKGAPAVAPPPPPPSRPAARAAPDEARPASAAELDEAPVVADERVPGRITGSRTSRVRAAAVNAVALVALLAVTLALWVVWRSEGPLDAASFRPSALLAALGRGGPSAGPWAAVDVRSGLYDRERGAPLVFVRGRVVSRAAAPVVAVRVAVQLVRGEEVIARAEGVAGAVPTPEELHAATDPVALASVVAAARARAPANVRPGDSVPFLVPVGDAPADVEGTAVRVEVGPAGGAAP